MKARFVVGPPGTGKTHKWIVKRYKKLLKEYMARLLQKRHQNCWKKE
jgi:predicted ATPase with chaperone activity